MSRFLLDDVRHRVQKGDLVFTREIIRAKDPIILSEALVGATEGSQLQIAADLLQAGANPDVGIEGAIVADDAKTVRTLVNLGANMNDDDLLLAAASNAPKVINWYLHTISPDQEDNVNKALIIASNHGYLSSVKVLLNYTGNVFEAFLSAANGGQLNVIEFLLDETEVSSNLELVRLAAYEAVSNGHSDVAKYILLRTGTVS